MPGFVMHIAIGQEYISKHSSTENYDEFILGNIDPDLTKEKYKTHYGKSPAYTSLKEFLNNNKLDSSLNKGRFLHLITDYLFYNYYLDRISKQTLHNDYDLINMDLINKYKVILPGNIKEYVFVKEGKPEILSLELACRVIDDISSMDINQIEKQVKEGNKKWEFYKNLI